MIIHGEVEILLCTQLNWIHENEEVSAISSQIAMNRLILDLCIQGKHMHHAKLQYHYMKEVMHLLPIKLNQLRFIAYGN